MMCLHVIYCMEAARPIDVSRIIKGISYASDDARSDDDDDDVSWH